MARFDPTMLRYRQREVPPVAPPDPLFLHLLVHCTLLMKTLPPPNKYRRRAKRKAGLPYVARVQLLSRGEMAFFRALRSAIGREYLITFKVRAADLLSCGEESWKAGFGYMVARHHLDFVVCDQRDSGILAAIELDDNSIQCQVPEILQSRRRRPVANVGRHLLDESTLWADYRSVDEEGI